MRTVFLIGNGFDLNLNLKTSYSEFYKFYINQESNKKVVASLKRSINSNLSNWADLKLELGNYTVNIDNQSDFDLIFDDVGENLAKFLIDREKELDINSLNPSVLFTDLCQAEKHLLPSDRRKVLAFKNEFGSVEHAVDIINFNYTKTIETILENNYQNLKLGLFRNKNPVILKNIYHIHGFTDDRMVFGVNDKSQIANESFHSNKDILESLIKNECNIAHKHTVEEQCQNLIKNANVICVFGSSLGDTDKIWWEEIGLRLKHSNARLIIFYKGETIPKRISHRAARYERAIKEDFLNKANVDDEIREVIDSRIFFCYNSKVFSLVK
ncbi:AbiH family protein [Nonlabens agnitus]|uniref:Bacteriophage abortive infection AbiH n=1 Tax=Nonlabens agnitus TaxID=870484 RepID=A0A2S9WY01_9FLAO|nr:AbiH family protein [Nonlabens agnitus]PRP68349.1 hypothetical protein BST86_08815 [Nonlabens agnitus]